MHGPGCRFQHYRDRRGAFQPHFEGCRALVDQHLDAAQGFCAGLGRFPQQPGFEGIIHQVIDQGRGRDAVAGQGCIVLAGTVGHANGGAVDDEFGMGGRVSQFGSSKGNCTGRYIPAVGQLGQVVGPFRGAVGDGQVADALPGQGQDHAPGRAAGPQD